MGWQDLCRFGAWWLSIFASPHYLNCFSIATAMQPTSHQGTPCSIAWEVHILQIFEEITVFRMMFVTYRLMCWCMSHSQLAFRRGLGVTNTGQCLSSRWKLILLHFTCYIPPHCPFSCPCVPDEHQLLCEANQVQNYKSCRVWSWFESILARNKWQNYQMVCSLHALWYEPP